MKGIFPSAYCEDGDRRSGGIDDPVFGDPGLRVLAAFGHCVPLGIIGTDNFHYEIGAAPVLFSQPVGVFSVAMKDDIRLAVFPAPELNTQWRKHHNTQSHALRRIPKAIGTGMQRAVGAKTWASARTSNCPCENSMSRDWYPVPDTPPRSSGPGRAGDSIPRRGWARVARSPRSVRLRFRVLPGSRPFSALCQLASEITAPTSAVESIQQFRRRQLRLRTNSP